MALFALFVAVPLIEIALFIQIGGLIGLWPTLLIVILTAALGTMLVRQQGMQAMGQLRQSFTELRDPSEALANGAMILFSGALLLTPGFFTDAVGFALLVPAVRTAVFAYLRKRIRVQQFEMGQRRAQPRRDGVIDADYTDVTPKGDTPSSSSGPGSSGPGSSGSGTSGWTRH